MCYKNLALGVFVDERTIDSTCALKNAAKRLNYAHNIFTVLKS